jgi:ABC-type multidrug transport system fused ATPase/permease subunit
MAFSFPKIQLLPIKRFFYTYKQILSIAYRVSPSLLTLVTLSNALWGLTNLPILYINKTLIDIVINNLGKPDLTNSLRIIIILAAIRAFLELIRSSLSGINRSLSATLTQRIEAYTELTFGQRLNTLDIPTVESSEFQDRYKKVERESGQRLWGMISPLSDIPNAIFTIISGLIPIFSFNPWLFLVVIGVSIPDILTSSRIAKKDYQAIEILNPKWRLWGWISDHLANPKNFYENRILGGTNYLARKLFNVQEEVLEHQYRRRINGARLRILGSFPTYVLSFVLNVYFFFLALVGKITLGSAQLLYGATNTLTTGFGTLVNDGVSIYENYLFMTDLVWFLDLKAELGDKNVRTDVHFKGGIEFKNVWFKYPHSKKYVLENINFTIGERENLALVGENGAGKTTLIKLLCGFYQPTKGQILVNGINVLDYDRSSYWKMLGVLFQDFSQYPFSAKESIGLGDVGRIRNIEEIKLAARLTGVDEFIDSLPLKYKTPLAKQFEKGVEPSRGQWQRIALARILFRNSPIVILDEPTSNVDPKAEEEIFEKILELAQDKILILISHRFSTVRKADRILNLDRGRIIEQGTHEELMKKDGEYADLFRLQAKGYQ